MMVTVFLYGVLKIILKNREYQSSLLLSLGLLLFFSYGHVYDYLKMTQPFGLILSRHRYLAPLWLLLLGLGIWVTLKMVKNPAAIVQVLNVIAIALLLLPSIQITSFFFSQLTSQNSRPVVEQTNNLPSENLENLPDVYLIILDMYARQDVLQDRYNFDNQPFLTELQELGFYVAECSRSNYDRTESSLASELNYDFIQNLIDINPQSSDHSILWPLIQHSKVRQQLANLGYQIVAFETGFPWSQLEDADLYLYPASQSSALSRITPFEAMLIKTTALFLLTDSQALFSQSIAQDANNPHYNRVVYTLSALEKLPYQTQPKFVFAHIVVPHPPYVFNPDGSMQTDSGFYIRGWGSPIDDQHEYDGYRNQIAFINDRITSVIKTILDKSQTPPIILLQSDHGVPPHRNANLAAYYLPGDNDQLLYPNITSVNTFRVVLNTFFGTQYPLLPDHTYTSESYKMELNLSESYEDLPDCLP